MASTGQPLNFGPTPAAPTGTVAVAFQADAPLSPPTIRNISANVAFAYDITIYIPAVQSIVSQEIFRMNVRRTLNFPGNFSGTVGGISCIAGGSALTAATASTTFIVNKNGTQIGTIVFAAAGTVPTFTTTSGAAQTYIVGDILTIVGPVTPDATLANWAVTLVATRTS